jgi:hypothetical protein
MIKQFYFFNLFYSLFLIFLLSLKLNGAENISKGIISGSKQTVKLHHWAILVRVLEQHKSGINSRLASVLSPTITIDPPKTFNTNHRPFPHMFLLTPEDLPLANNAVLTLPEIRNLIVIYHYYLLKFGIFLQNNNDPLAAYFFEYAKILTKVWEEYLKDLTKILNLFEDEKTVINVVTVKAEHFLSIVAEKLNYDLENKNILTDKVNFPSPRGLLLLLVRQLAVKLDLDHAVRQKFYLFAEIFVSQRRFDESFTNDLNIPPLIHSHEVYLPHIRESLVQPPLI